MEREKKLLLETIGRESDQLKQDLSYLHQNVSANLGMHSYKSSSKSTLERKIGNDLYLATQAHDADKHYRIFVQYNKSMAYAPPDSEELALAHANRSAFLLHIKKYENSIMDIDAALSITKSKLLQFKLLCRKIECLKSIGSNSCGEVIYSAQTCLDSIINIEATKLYNLPDQLERVKTIRPDKSILHSSDSQLCSDKNEKLEAKEKIFSNAINIKYNKTYGRHIVANKDFNPGDIIFTEKPFVTIINHEDDMDRYMFCEHCFKPLWSAVGCKTCHWALYCSENCRDKSCKSYHKVECNLISKWENIKVISSGIVHVYIRTILKAVEEFGSLKELQLQLKIWDDQKGIKDPCIGFIENETISDTFRGIYSLSFNDNDSFAHSVTPTILFVLIFLIKNNFIKNWELKQVKDLITNEEMTFLGTLLLRIVSIYPVNAITSPTDGGTIYDCKTSKDYKAYNLATLTSLINHSCYPNGSWTCTENNDIIVYALQPIKKNEQVFITYFPECRTKSKSERLAFLKDSYNFICTCLKCTNDWPSMKEWELMVAIINKDKQRKHFTQNLFLRSANDENTKGTSSMNSMKPPSFAAFYSTVEVQIEMEKLFNPKDESFKKCI